MAMATAAFGGSDEAFNERVRFFHEFLDQDYGQNQYKNMIIKMVQKDEHRLVVNINHIRQHSREYADGLLKEPMDFLPAFDKALQEVATTVWDAHMPTQDMGLRRFHIGLEGSFGEQSLSPRHLNSSFLGTMICLEGIVTRCSLVRPKVSRSVHYCEETQLFYSREYRDGTSIENAVPTGSVYPKEDDQGNALTTEFGLSTYRDYQTMCIQEMPERSPAGLLPRPTDVILDDDLVDRVKPGDRVRLVGVYRSIGKHAASISATFKAMIIANNVSLLEKEIHQPVITEVDAREIRKLGKRRDIFKLLSRSFAPSIFGHDYIKKALLLLMMGGVEKNLDNGTHLRGDVNVLLIGDPSVGKSQLLRFVMNLAPLAIATTGRGSSGVGLTAAVTQDKETGERTLEAGAMVLADRGIVCIDEFDKMSDIDRVAIHEVMEQQTVTIAKAGIHTSLNARCSVLAAANPAFGTYLDEKKPFENITLPDSLLSRFDLVFVMLDKTDDEFNRAISDHITRLHRFVPDGLEEGAPMTDAIIQSIVAAAFGQRGGNGNADGADGVPERPTPVFQKYNELLHVGIRAELAAMQVGGSGTASGASTPRRGNRRNSGRGSRRGDQEDAGDIEILSIPFLKKYLYYTKTKIRPVLTQDACDYISTRYAELRSREDGRGNQYRTMPLTPRTLETLIRLATAHAKCRLSKSVEVSDAEVAYEILVFALFKEVRKKRREKRAKTTAGGADTDAGSDEEEDSDAGGHDDGDDDGGHDGESDVTGAGARSRRSGAARSGRVASSRRSTAAGSSRFSELVDTEGSVGPSSGPASTAPMSGIGSSSRRSRGANNNANSSVGGGEGSTVGTVLGDSQVTSSSIVRSGNVAKLAPARFDLFRRRLARVRERMQDPMTMADANGADTSTVLLTEIVDAVNAADGDGSQPSSSSLSAMSQAFSPEEVHAALVGMSDDNMGVWYQSDIETLMFI